MNRGVIFDLDNTLYLLQSPDGSFARSRLNAALQANARQFLRLRLGQNEQQVEALMRRAHHYGGLSLAVEQLFGVSRYDWFAIVWDMDPRHYITSPGTALASRLAPLAERSLVLTSGPAVWATRALQYLGVRELFGDRLMTGEPDVRKPQAAAFLAAAAQLGREPSDLVSVGDTNASDILPARKLGMRTIIVGPEIRDAHFRDSTVFGAIDRILSWEAA